MGKYIHNLGENLQTLVRVGRAKIYTIQLGIKSDHST